MIVTMIWNDCHSDGVSDTHWHTCAIDMARHRDVGEAATVRAIMLDYYERDACAINDAFDLVDEAMVDYGLVGIFEGIPTTI